MKTAKGVSHSCSRTTSALSLRPLLLALLLGCAASALAATAGYESPAQAAGATTITLEPARQMDADGVTFIDVRHSRLYARSHIPGAIHLNLSDSFNFANLSSHVAKDQPFVLYCSGVRCNRSSRAADWAVEWGFSRVQYFRAGIAAWRKAGYPEDSGE